MNCNALLPFLSGVILLLTLGGCQSPYHSDQGALAGGLLGAGTGAVVGHALGSTAGGALIGAGVGALGGAAIGAGMDESEARNRALIEQKLGRQVVAGAVTAPEVVSMTRSGVDDDLIVNHIRSHGVAAPMQSADLIYLQQQGVHKRVIEALQTQPPVQVAQPVAAVPVYPGPQPVMVQEYWAPPPPPGYYYRPCYRPEPNVSWGVSVSGR
jgi:hypothetical protein